MMRLRVSDRFARDIAEEAERVGLSHQAYLHACVSYALRRGENVHIYREITLNPRSESTVDQLFDWLMARRPTLHDLVAPGSGGVSLSGPLQRAMRAALHPHEYTRMMGVLLHGRTLEEVGQAEGCSKQAVHTSVRKATRRLVADDAFVAALCAHFPDAGYTPALLRAALASRKQGVEASRGGDVRAA